MHMVWLKLYALLTCAVFFAEVLHEVLTMLGICTIVHHQLCVPTCNDHMQAARLAAGKHLYV
jgi:hypothetical protein